MVDVVEGKKIETEAEEISKELCTTFETHFKESIQREEKIREIIYDIALKTLVCKANRDSRIFYVSKHQLKDLLDGKILDVKRRIPVDTKHETTEIQLRRSD